MPYAWHMPFLHPLCPGVPLLDPRAAQGEVPGACPLAPPGGRSFDSSRQITLLLLLPGACVSASSPGTGPQQPLLHAQQANMFLTLRPAVLTETPAAGSARSPGAGVSCARQIRSTPFCHTNTNWRILSAAMAQ